VELKGQKPRAVLAVLLLHANEPVSWERLALAVWGEDSAADAREKVQVNVSRVRKALGNGEILATRPAGYELRVLPGELDADRFERLVEAGRAALEAGRPERASVILNEALGLWRGSPLAELTFESFAQADIARLEEQRLAAIEVRVTADLAAGRHAELVPELGQLAEDNPTRERLAGQLMLALYRCGRQADALEAYREARARLVEDIGVEPGPELRSLHEAILRQDASLEPPAAARAELPRALDAAAAPPLIGRDAELAWLQERWETVQHGAGPLVTITGPQGSGKTRLAAELAGGAHRLGAPTLYATCTGPADAVRDVLEQARRQSVPTLLVVDDADWAPPDIPLDLDDRPVLTLVCAREAMASLRADGELALGPLDVAAVRAIATGYAPEEDEVPAEWLLEASGGVPGRVHELAGEWARRQAAERVGAVAGRAATGRMELRSIEAELAGGVARLQTARERVERPDDGRDTVVCPFKGLASFEAADAPYFFGREQLVAELVARLVGSPLLGVVGPSGSGKSSVVRAGLLPALAEGVLPGSEGWPLALIRPGEHPLGALREAIDGLGSERRAVLAVDQFEETFTACRDEDERAAFTAELVRTGQEAEGAVLVVALRADYYGRCAAYPELSDLLAANHVLVGPMQRTELERAVVCPAQRAGLHVEPDLVDALVRDVEGAPGALPLLSTALLELWQRRDGRRLRLASYEQIGGVQKAVARLAEEAFSRLDERQQGLARRILLRLVEVDDEGGVERRRLPLAELGTETGEDVEHVLGLLADRRLLTISEGTVELAHEALLREWPRLCGWIEDDLEGMRIERRLSADAREWVRIGRDQDALYRGARLAEAHEWSDRDDLRLADQEREFLDASLDRERREARTHRRNLAIAFGSLVLGIVAITAIALVAIDQRRDAVRERDTALSRELALRSSDALADDPELALRLALWADDTAPTEQSGTALREATLAFRQLAVLPADSLDANTAAYSPDGRHVVTGGTDGRALVWDVAKREAVASLAAGHGAVLAARYAPGGDSIAIGFKDGTIALTDGSLRAPHKLLRVEDRKVNDLAFSADGKRIAAALDDGTVRVLTTDGSDPVQRLAGHQGPVLGVDISADATQVVSAGDDGSVRLWNVEDGEAAQVLHSGEKPETDVAFSPDGRRILGVGRDRWIRFWNARTGAEETKIRGEGRELLAAAFSTDGRRFAAGGRDGVTRVWSVGGGPPVAVLRGQRSPIFDVGFGPTGDRVVSAGDDGTVRIWDAGQTVTWTVPSKTDNLDFNHDGRILATSSEDGTVRVWDTATGRLQASLPGPKGYTAVKFSPTSDALLISSYEASRVRLWPWPSSSARVVVQTPTGRGINDAAFDANGDRIVYAEDKTGRLIVRNLRSRREVRLRGTPKTVYGAEFSPDGERVVAVTENDLLAWRVDRPAHPEHVLRGHRGPVNALDFSSDGRLVTAGADRTVRIWDSAGRPTLVMQGHKDEVTTVVFTADGNRVLSSSFDGTLRLWDARTGAMLAVLSAEDELYDVALSRDGKIATLGKGEVVRVFRCEVCGSLNRVRALALSRSPRPLTAVERRRLLAAAG
jgi:WD40 repeat protein/DNA-binding SARP family transcriptional activator